MYCVSCKHDFKIGLRAPALLECGHNMCIECVRAAYQDDKAFEESKELELFCSKDKLVTKYMHLRCFYDDSEILDLHNEFNEFVRLNVQINHGLLQVLVKNNSDMA